MARKSGERRRRAARDRRQRFSLWRWLRNSFFAGVVVATPITVTAWLVYTFVNFVDNSLKPRIPDIYNPETYLREVPGIPEGFAIPGLGLVFAVLVLTMLGAFARNFFGRGLLAAGERLVAGLPVVRNIYGALKQLVETIASRQENSFKEVALVEYPRKGLYALAFVTADAKGEVRRRLGGSYVGVFIPTTPNPTSGFILYAKRDEIQVLDMTVEEGAKLIISAGLVSPEDRSESVDPAVVFTEPPEGLTGEAPTEGDEDAAPRSTGT